MALETDTYPERVILTSGAQAIAIGYFIKNSDLKMTVFPVSGAALFVGTEGVDYSLSGTNNENGGSLTTIGLTTGDTVTIERNMDFEQNSSYPTAGKFNESNIERDLDERTMEAQQNRGDMDRAIRIPVNETPTAANTIMESIADRANKIRSYDVNGNLSLTTPSSSSVTANNALGIDYDPPGAGAVQTNVQAKLRETPSAADKGFLASASAGANALALQAIVSDGNSFHIPDGFYDIDDEILIDNSNITIFLSAGVKITQVTADKAIFKCTSQDDVWIEMNGATLFGEGSWSAGWTGNSGHNDRVVQFINCGFSGINDGSIKNGANAGLYLEACTHFRSNGLLIEGSDQNGTTIPALANFQNGIFVKHSSANGNCQDCQFSSFDISGTAQGVLVESHSTYSYNPDNLRFTGIIHDITGQHGMYIQAGGVTVDITVRDINLDGCKVQTPSSDNDIENFNIKVLAADCGSHGVLIQNAATEANTAIGSSGSTTVMTDTSRTGADAWTVNEHVGKTIVNGTTAGWQIITSNTADTTTGLALQDGSDGRWDSGDAYEIVGVGKISGLNLDLVCDTASRALGVDNNVHDLHAVVNAKNSGQNGVNIAGVGNADIDVHLHSNGSTQHGVEITAINSTGIRFHDPVIKDAGGSSYDGFSIGSLSNTTGIEIHNPTITDSRLTTSRMRYGIFNVSDTASFTIFGKRVITNFQTLAVRNSGLNTVNARDVLTLGDDSTPTVINGSVYVTGTGRGTSTITDLDEGSVGQEVTILAQEAFTVTDGTNMLLNGSVNFVMAAGDTVTLFMFVDQVWEETGRKVNL